MEAVVKRRFGVIFGTAVLIGAVGFVGASATGAQVLRGVAVPNNTLTINKTVVGTVPTGTTFTVTATCDSTITPGSPEIFTAHFDSTGAATDTHAFSPKVNQQCTVTETGDGGATTVGYQCTFAPRTTAAVTPGSCDSPTGHVVTFGSISGDSGTVTVTNTFTPTPTTTTTPTATAPAAVAVTPTFTG
jgi:hypothetical protein